jgi:hypothetical protein
MILEDSHRMSAVFARRILSSLLKQYAKLPGERLTKDVDAFIADKSLPLPLRLRENLHSLRKMGDFGAHEREDEADGTIIDIDPEEAKWTLEVIADLFDYFIVEPEREQEAQGCDGRKDKESKADAH